MTTLRMSDVNLEYPSMKEMAGGHTETLGLGCVCARSRVQRQQNLAFALGELEQHRE